MVQVSLTHGSGLGWRPPGGRGSRSLKTSGAAAPARSIARGGRRTFEPGDHALVACSTKPLAVSAPRFAVFTLPLGYLHTPRCAPHTKPPHPLHTQAAVYLRMPLYTTPRTPTWPPRRPPAVPTIISYIKQLRLRDNIKQTNT